MNDLKLILTLLKKLGFKISSFDNNSWDFDKEDSPIHIKISKIEGMKIKIEN